MDNLRVTVLKAQEPEGVISPRRRSRWKPIGFHLRSELVQKRRELLHRLLCDFDEFQSLPFLNATGFTPLRFQLVVGLVELDYQFEHLPGQRRSDIYGLSRRCALRTLSNYLRLLFPHDLSHDCSAFFVSFSAADLPPPCRWIDSSRPSV